jgi:hypothetical protein
MVAYHRVPSVSGKPEHKEVLGGASTSISMRKLGFTQVFLEMHLALTLGM